MGYHYLSRNKLPDDRGSKTLKDQLLHLSFDTTKRIKVFSLLIRLFIAILLGIIIALDLVFGVYRVEQSYPLVAIIVIYGVAVSFFLRQTVHLGSIEKLRNHFDLIYVTVEILAVYAALVLFPTSPANMYSNSLKGFFFTIIVLSVFTGRWYFGLYSGILTGALNLSLLLFYEPIANDFAAHGIDFEKVSPSIQTAVLSVYYVLTGALISFPFYLFHKQQNLAINLRAEVIIAQPYFDLSIPDGDIGVGEYLVTKIMSSSEAIGADYVAWKPIGDGTYMMIIGDTIGHGINRSPGAIIAMAAFHGSSVKRPLDALHSINKALYGVTNESGGETLCLAVKLGKQGLVEFAGKAESMVLVKGPKQKSVNIPTKGEILGSSEDLKYTQPNSVRLSYGHMLIIKTDGAEYDSIEDDKTVVMITRLPKSHITKALMGEQPT